MESELNADDLVMRAISAFETVFSDAGYKAPAEDYAVKILREAMTAAVNVVLADRELVTLDAVRNAICDQFKNSYRYTTPEEEWFLRRIEKEIQNRVSSLLTAQAPIQQVEVRCEDIISGQVYRVLVGNVIRGECSRKEDAEFLAEGLRRPR